jgi:hypothetical protein
VADKVHGLRSISGLPWLQSNFDQWLVVFSGKCALRVECACRAGKHLRAREPWGARQYPPGLASIQKFFRWSSTLPTAALKTM